MRAVRWILITVAVLAGIFIAADFALRAYAESNVAAAIQAELQLSRQPDLTLGGFPFLPRAASGHLERVTADVGDVTVEGELSFRRVEVTLHEVSFSAPRLLFGRSTTVETERGDGTARMTGEDLTRAIQGTAPGLEVRLVDGRMILSGQGLRELAVRASINQGTLHLRPETGPQELAIRVDLGELVPGVRYTRIRLEGSEAVVSLSLRRLSFQI